MYSLSEKGFLSGFQVRNWDIRRIASEINAFDVSKQYKPSSFCVGLLCEESSSRTRFSTETILKKLGANVVNIYSLQETSVKKGETIRDSAYLWGKYFDLIAIRSSISELPMLFNKYSSAAIVNLGDSYNEHPTQGLATIVHTYNHFGEIANLNVCLWGDFILSRTAHSVAIMFALLGANIYIYSIPKITTENEYIKRIYKACPNAKIKILNEETDLSAKMHVIYINRQQKERWGKEVPEYRFFGERYQKWLRGDGIILHPLPHNDEIDDTIINHANSRILEHIDVTYRTRAWIFYCYKRAYDNHCCLDDNSMNFEEIYYGDHKI